MTDKERTLLQTLYNFYSEEGSSGYVVGDEVVYEKPGAKHSGKTGKVRDVRADGKVGMRIDDFVFYGSPEYVKKVGKPKNIERLFKILDQMVADGDLSKEAMEKFLKAVNIEKKRKEIDPYEEENWDEEDVMPLKPRKKGANKPRYSGYDPCSSGGRSTPSC
jgi:hypothetical protein